MPSYPRRRAVSLHALTLGAALAAGALITPSAFAQDVPAPGTPTTTAPVTPPAPTPPAPAPTERTVAAGVKVGTLDLSGQTRDQATASLTAALQGRPSNADIVIRIAGRPHKLKMAAIDYGYDPAKTASRARNAPAGSTVIPVYTWNVAKVRSWATSLSKMGKASRNATVKIGITRQRIRGSQKGWGVTRQSVEKVAGAALDNPQADRAKLSVKVVRKNPSVTINGLKSQYGTLVTVDRQTFTLRVFKRLGLSKTYKIAVGAAGHDTPSGMYSVTSKQVNPAWYVPNSAWAGSLQGQVIPGGAPNNPLKARWLGLRDGIGIHGTSEAWSIGSRASHGCIRMHPHDVIDLYGRVPMGTAVKVR